MKTQVMLSENQDGGTVGSYVGMDDHKKSSFLSVMDARGLRNKGLAVRKVQSRKFKVSDGRTVQIGRDRVEVSILPLDGRGRLKTRLRGKLRRGGDIPSGMEALGRMRGRARSPILCGLGGRGEKKMVILGQRLEARLSLWTNGPDGSPSLQ